VATVTVQAVGIPDPLFVGSDYTLTLEQDPASEANYDFSDLTDPRFAFDHPDETTRTVLDATVSGTGGDMTCHVLVPAATNDDWDEGYYQVFLLAGETASPEVVAGPLTLAVKPAKAGTLVGS
jgi:hypothetical protein